MIISYPFLPTRADDETEEAYFQHLLDLELKQEGVFPVSFDLRWHGGIHMTGDGGPVRAIADGEVVAFRAPKVTNTYGELGEFDTGFVLLKHETETGENTPIVFYSLYMHLKPNSLLTEQEKVLLPAFIRNATTGNAVQRPENKKIYRKSTLGFIGKAYNKDCLHFEIFTTDAALTRFWHDSSAVTETGSDDVYGDTHFVIPANKAFVARHPNAVPPHKINFPGNNDFDLPVGTAGQNVYKLYVTVRLTRGNRITTTVAETAPEQFEQIGELVQANYEYELYRLATALYPDCPSAGFEWLRFGRMLGPDATATEVNWQAVSYAPGQIGYIDLAQDDIPVLSDADFPHWRGWKKIDEGATHNAQDGLCDVNELLTLLDSADINQDDELSEAEQTALLNNPDVRRKFRHLIVKHPSEWDKTSNDTKFARLREPGEDLEQQEDWDEFKQHIELMQFWTDAGLGDSSVWHFHPLQFIKHMRGCGWLSAPEFAACIPRRNRHLVGTQFNEQLVANWNTALTRGQRWHQHLNWAARKYAISNSPRHQVHFMSQVIEESGYLRLVVEGGGENASYAPWYGRGLIQLTHLGNYQEYGRFRAFPAEQNIQAQYSALGWNPDTLIAQNDANCADSAGFYWVCPIINASKTHMGRLADPGLSVTEVLAVSRGINGNVAVQKVNGLDIRNQLVVYIKYVLMDDIFPANPTGEVPTVPLSFTWRNRSSPTPFTAVQHNINVILTPQRP